MSAFAGGGKAIATTVQSGAYVNVLRGGIDISASVASATVSVFAGGTDIGAAVGTGGYAADQFRRYRISATLTGLGDGVSFGLENVLSGGRASNTRYRAAACSWYPPAGSPFRPLSTASALPAPPVAEWMFSAASPVPASSAPAGRKVFSPAVPTGERGSAAADCCLSTPARTGFGAIVSGGTLSVASGGRESGATLSSTGALSVASGGIVVSTIVRSVGLGGVGTGLDLLGGTASSTVISSGGQESILSGGIDIGATINLSGTQLVQLGGFASGATINAGGIQDIASGGSARGIVVKAGGTEILEFGRHGQRPDSFGRRHA